MRCAPVLVLVVAAGCSRDRATPPAPSSPASAPASAAPDAARPGADPGGAVPLAPLAPGRQGSTVVLASLEGRAVALVADADARAVQVIDRQDGRLVSSYALGAEPGQMLIDREGRLLVAVRGGREVAALSGRAGGRLGREASVATAPEPSGLALTPDGGTLLVASAWGRRLEGFAVATGERAFAAALPRDPRSVLVTDDGRSAYVSHAAGSRLTRVALPSGADVTSIRLDGVTNIPTYMGNHSYRSGVQGFAVAQLGARVLAPQALVHAGLRLEKMGQCGRQEPERMDMCEISSDRPRRPAGRPAAASMYGGSCEDPYPIALQSVAVVDTARPRVLGPRPPPLSFDGPDEAMTTQLFHRSLGPGEVAEPASVVLPSAADAAQVRQLNACTLPRAAVVDPARGSLLVACQGRDVVVELDATAADPARHERRRFAVPAGPTGLAIDPERREAVVWSQFDRSLAVLPLGAPPPPAPGGQSRPGRQPGAPGPARPAIEALAPSARWALPAGGALDPALASGRRLFHALDDERISGDGRACATCHPDGRDDALVWSAPGGPRQTPSLAGRPLARTGPYGWSGEHDSLSVHLEHTFRRLRGKGLEGAERDDLLAYVQSLPPPPREPAAGPQVARGRELFEGATGCAGCHGVGLYTDGQPHDVRSGGAFDTPSLALVGGTAPYFHDGRYPTLRSVLLDCEGKMGSTAALSPADLDALEAFLDTL